MTLVWEAPLPCADMYVCCIAREPPTSGEFSETPVMS